MASGRGRFLIGASVLVSLWCAGTSAAETGIVAMSADTFHQGPDPLIAFGSGRAVSLVPHMGALVRHEAADEDIVLVFLESGAVARADEDLADWILYDEESIGRQVRKLLSGPGGVLLIETGSGATEPRSAPSAQLVEASGAKLLLSPDPPVPVPEPGVALGAAAGAMLLAALRPRRASEPPAR